MNTGMEYIVFALLSLGLSLSDLYLTEANVTWNTAELKCRDQNTTLPSIMDLHRYSYESFKFTSVWSSVRGTFTPWITSTGCYIESSEFLWKYEQHSLTNNTVGNCYRLCSSSDDSKGGCKSRNHFFFGLKSITCTCICRTTPNRQFLTDSRNCNIPCLSSIDNGYCGGESKYISIYKKGNTEDNCYSLEQIADSGWVYKRRGCNESLPFVCKPSTNYTSQSTQTKTKETSTRTTEKKSTHLLPLYTDKTDSYFTLSSTLKSNSLKNPASLPPHTVTNYQNASPVAYATSAIINVTIRSPMQNIRKKEPNSGTIGAIVGSCVAVIIVCICVSIILLFLRLKKRRNKQKTSIKFTNTSQDRTSIDIHVNINLQPTLPDKEEVYVEKVDGEYDTLNAARQRKSCDGDLNYDCATGSENYYSSTAQSEHSYQETTYGSDYNTMIGNQYNKNSTKNNDYDTCNQFVTVGGDVYARVKK